MSCYICNEQRLKRKILIHEISRYTGEAYPLYRCTNCGFIRPVPLPYRESSKLAIYDNPENKRIDEKDKEYIYYFRHFSPYIELVKKYKIRGKMLDVGCGAGHLMILLARYGMKAEGQEISPELVTALKKRFIVHGHEINKMKKRNYDLITFNQVLEHIEDPRKFLKSVNLLLKNEGYIIFAVPYLYGLIPNVLRSYWYGLGYGQHLNFFSKDSISRLFNDTGNAIF